MAKRSNSGPDPSDCVHDEYRERNAGVVDVPMNSKRSTGNFYLNRSTLGTHTEYEPSTNPKKPWDGKYVEKQNHMKQHTRDTMGDLHRSPASREGTRDRENRGFRCATGRHGAGQCDCVPSSVGRG